MSLFPPAAPGVEPAAGFAGPPHAAGGGVGAAEGGAGPRGPDGAGGASAGATAALRGLTFGAAARSLGFPEDILKPYVEARGGAWESTTVSDVYGSLDGDMYAALWAVKTEEGADITPIVRGQLRALLRGLAQAAGLPPRSWATCRP